jgi:hypothetical protein
MLQSCRAGALLVNTVVGKLQVTRFLRDVGVESRVLTDPDEARRWLEAVLEGSSEP